MKQNISTGEKLSSNAVALDSKQLEALENLIGSLKKEVVFPKKAKGKTVAEPSGVKGE